MIIGILAAIAAPKFSNTKEKAYTTCTIFVGAAPPLAPAMVEGETACN